MSLWPHQEYGINETRRLIDSGETRIGLTSPTGGGKSRIMFSMCEWGWPTVIYANRKMLIEQLCENMAVRGIGHGIQASGYAPSVLDNVQVASIQTVAQRWKSGEMELHPAKLVIVDEIHNEKGTRVRELLDEHERRGAAIVGVTATPIGIGHLVRKLVVAGTTSELRACGALVPAYTFAPDEPAMESFKPKTRGILQFRDEVREAMLHVIIGRVLEYFPKYNPDRKPTICFAPGVPESQWLAEEFFNAGYTAAHIDGERIWINGEYLPSTKENRETLKREAERGNVQVTCNRFVLREGVDWPFLAHCIFACSFGSLSSYLQAGGRLLRAHESLDRVTVQDHGGNFHRHDSLNCDRVWSLDKSDAQIQGERIEQFRTKAAPEPIVCPQCKAVRKTGVTCPSCNFTAKSKRRVVIQTDGQLKEVTGDIYRERRVSTSPALHKAWSGCVFRCRNSGRTFNQARALFQRENHGMCPGPDFPFMPKSEGDWYLRVGDVYPAKSKQKT